MITQSSASWVALYQLRCHFAPLLDGRANIPSRHRSTADILVDFAGRFFASRRHRIVYATLGYGLNHGLISSPPNAIIRVVLEPPRSVQRVAKIDRF